MSAIHVPKMSRTSYASIESSLDVEVTEEPVSAEPLDHILHSHHGRYSMLCEPEWPWVTTVRSVTGTSAITNKVNRCVFAGNIVGQAITM